jgi:hypothetical protein
MPTANATIKLKDNTLFTSTAPQQSVTVDASAFPGALQTLTIAPSADINDNRDNESHAVGWRNLDSAGIRISVKCFNKLVSCGFDGDGVIYYDESTGAVSEFALQERAVYRAHFRSGPSVQAVATAIIEQTAIMCDVRERLTQIATLLERRDSHDTKKANGRDAAMGVIAEGLSSFDSTQK